MRHVFTWSCAFAMAAQSAAFAAPLIDQVSPGGGSNFFGIESLGRNGHSFKAGQNNISGVGLTLRNANGVTAPLTVEIWDSLWISPGANRIAQQTANATAAAGFIMNDIFFTPAATTPGQVYFIRLIAADSTFVTGGFIGDPYPNGAPVLNNVLQGSGAWNSSDMTFRTWYEPAVQAESVPEPSTLTLLGGALLPLALLRGRKGR